MSVSDQIGETPLLPRLALRYGEITATVRPSGAADPDVQDTCVRFFARRGLPVAAEPGPDADGFALRGRFDPSRDPLFCEAVEQWRHESGCAVTEIERASGAAGADDAAGYQHDWEREARYRPLASKVANDLGFTPREPDGEEWSQALAGSAGSARVLADAFHTLRHNGRISRFPQRGITVARQGTCAPYGAPAMLLHLVGTCRQFSEKLGMHLLEATPRLKALSEIAPGVALVESTPRLDGIWDEARFWAAWQSLPQEAWSLVQGWAAVRVLRYVETPEGTDRIYAAAYLPRHITRAVDDLPSVPDHVARLNAPGAARWQERRCCEIALALGARTDASLRRHLCGSLATPHPFPRPLGPAAGDIRAIEDWLARAATALHTELLAPESADRALIRIVREGLLRIQTALLAQGAAPETVHPRTLQTSAERACSSYLCGAGI
ncbi:MAG TPA: hypothetical protein VGM37_17305 [Armatimonadota bacterium]|jgi:hypothetical protein